MIRMGKQIGGKLITVPHQPASEIVPDRFPVDPGPAFIDDKAVECPDSQVSSNHLTRRPQWFRLPDCNGITDIITGFHLRQILLSVTVSEEKSSKEQKQ